jgi:hypothetical protein
MRDPLLPLIGILAALTAAAPAPPTTAEDFATAVRVTGAEYRAARERLMGPGVDVAYLEGKLRSDVPKERLMAVVILGWRDHGQEYTRRLGEFLTDPRGRKRYHWASDPAALKPEYLPLLYEFLLKGGAQGEDNAGGEAAWRAIGFLARRGVEVDADGLGRLLRPGELPAPARAAVARTVAALPATAVRASDLLSLLGQEAASRPGDRYVASALLDGLAERGPRLPGADRDDLVQRLLRLPGLSDLVGATAVARAAGGLGGRDAVAPVARYLGRDADSALRRWAISTLADNRDHAARSALEAFLKTKDARETEYIYAMRRLAEGPYEPPLGEVLVGWVVDPERPDRGRAEALEALDTLYRANRDDPDAERDLRSRLERLELPDRSGAALRARLGRLKAGLASPARP